MWFVLATPPPMRMTQPNPGSWALPLTIDTVVGGFIRFVSKEILNLGVGPNELISALVTCTQPLEEDFTNIKPKSPL